MKEATRPFHQGVLVNKSQMEEAHRKHVATQCQSKALQNEISRLFILASTKAMSTQTAAINRSLEMCSNKIDKYLPSQSRFCATLFDAVNRHQHLEISSKLSAIQAFLTKTRNRGLPTKTLTSGMGIIFNFKDLNECIHDFCLEMLMFSEKSLKVRSEAYQSKID